MWLSPVAPASAWSQSSESAQQGERHVIEVTLMLNASSFAPPPEQPNDEPVEPVPPVPVAVPELPQGPDDAPPSTQPTTAKPPAPDKPITVVPDNEQPPQPLALDLPVTEASDAPLPPIAEASKPEVTTEPEPREEQIEVPEPTAEAPANDPVKPAEPIDKPSEETTSERVAEPVEPGPETPSEPQDPVAETEDQPEPPAEPATETTEASDPAEEQTDAPETEADAPASVVYDEDSVDQPITFDKKTRPKQSTVSKRRGESGTVRIRIEVDADGKLIRQEVLDDAGHPRLLKAAMSALDDSTFQPAEREGEPVRSTRVIEYRF
jgi:protein TonB